ncbi:hypothetical protein KI387_035834 [Taxus chinensis]|uniref:NAC domain-containing protein n=1 Tax=Taxus chinensis TaxID=29808 RepID=A0AA38KJW5_TAXCH|nr:hypothetical protein KI387_035834 [Taxus chinensis]
MEKVDFICAKEQQLQQFPGFRFHPTKEELVGFYLRRKVEKKSFKLNLIRDLDLYAFKPCDLPGLALVGGEREREWFFFVEPRGHNDGRPNRITTAGFWKATGTDKPVYCHSTSKLIGLRKTLVFYKGRALKGRKMDWIMNEYRLYLVNDEENLSIPKLEAEVSKSEIGNVATLDYLQGWCCCDGGTYKCGEECGIRMVKGLENLCTSIVEAEVCESEREDLTHLDSLQAWWCCGGRSSNSMDAICTNLVQ